MYNIKKKIFVIVGLENELETLSKLPVQSCIGYGSRNSKNCLKNLEKDKIDHVVSFGFCGSVDDKIKTGEIVIPKNISVNKFKKNPISEKIRKSYIKKLNGFTIHQNNLYTTKSVIFSEREKRKIKNKFKASIIDMESKFIQEECQKLKIPFVVVRLVFDDLKFSLPEFIVKSLNENGKLIIAQVALSTIKNPKKLNQLIKLGFHYFTNKRRLAKIAKLIFS